MLVRSSSAVWMPDVVKLTGRFADPLCSEGRGSCSQRSLPRYYIPRRRVARARMSTCGPLLPWSWRIKRSGLRSSGKRVLKAYFLSQIARCRTQELQSSHLADSMGSKIRRDLARFGMSEVLRSNRYIHNFTIRPSPDLTSKEPTRNTGLLFKCLESESYCCAYVGGSLKDWCRQAETNLTCCTIDDLTFKAPDPVVYATASLRNRLSTQSTSASPTSTYLSAISPDLIATQADITSSSTADSAFSGGSTQQVASSQALSTGAKVGPGIGLPLGVLEIDAIGAFFWLRRR